MPELLAVEILQIVNLPNSTMVVVDYGYTPSVLNIDQRLSLNATMSGALPQIINYLDFRSFSTPYEQTNSLFTVRINPDFDNANQISATPAQTTIIFE